jgi:DNA polymerase III subunit epsilon
MEQFLLEKPDSKISNMRLEVYRNNTQSFDDICFTIYKCPECYKEVINMTLLPIVEKSNIPKNELTKIQESVLNQIAGADFDFLHEKNNCSCSHMPYLDLKRIIYCYHKGDVDCHNYIDYPFEKVEKFELQLNEVQPNKKHILFFDTETTGLPKNWRASYKELENWPRLVQIAWILCDMEGNISEQKSYIIKPQGFQIPIETSNLHGINTERALMLGKDLNFVLQEFQEALESAELIVGHNIDFDRNVIGSELFRNKNETNIFELNSICTMQSTTEFCKIPNHYGYKYPSLSELYNKLFKTNLDEAHDAAVDIKATYKCFFKLMNLNVIKIKTNEPRF